MKKLFSLLITVSLLGACTEVSVKQVEKCAKVVDVKMFRSYFLGTFPERFEPDAYKIFDNGKRIKIYQIDYEPVGKEKWIDTAKRMNVGNNYCWTEYEKVK